MSDLFRKIRSSSAFEDTHSNDTYDSFKNLFILKISPLTIVVISYIHFEV